MELDTATIDNLASLELTKEQSLERGFLVDEAMTSESNIISYNNFYEFSTDKNAVAEAAKHFDTSGWQIRVEEWSTNPELSRFLISKRLARLKSASTACAASKPGRW